MMNENIIKIYDNNDFEKEYKILLVIEKDYYYIVYTDLNNYSIKKDLSVIKVDSLEHGNIITMDDNDWKMIEQEYNNLIK